MNKLQPQKFYNLRKEEHIEGKKKEEKQMIQFVVNTIIMLANWAQIEITKIFLKKPYKLITIISINLNIYILHFSVIETCSMSRF